MAAYALAIPSAVHAFADGQAPTPIVSHRLTGNAVTIGASVSNSTAGINVGIDNVGPSSSISGLPGDAQVVQAVLFWSARDDGGADPDVVFRLPSGASVPLNANTLLAGESDPGFNGCDTEVFGTDVYYKCRRDVTFLVAGLGAGGAGAYGVGGIEGREGGFGCFLGNAALVECLKDYAAWSLVVFWESPTETVTRDLVLYDAFLGVDEVNSTMGFDSGLSPGFTLSGFEVGESANVDLTVMGFEGSGYYGNPPQDQAGSLAPFCPSCPDFVEVSGGGGTVRLGASGGTVNAVGNLFDGQGNVTGSAHPGFDLDRFELGPTGLGALVAGDTFLTLSVGSGDGLAGNGDPGFVPTDSDLSESGERVILGYALIRAEAPAPVLTGDKAVNATDAFAGDTLTYTLQIANVGAASATDVVVSDVLPAGLTYVPGSTTNTCGVDSSDVGASTPLAAGLAVGDLGPGTSCTVTVQASIDINVASGTTVENTATLSASNHADVVIGPASTAVQSVNLGAVTKRDAVLGGADPIPGAVVVYTIEIPNLDTFPLSDLSVRDQLPPELELTEILSIPPGATNQSNLGAGLVDVRNITAPGQTSVSVVFAAQIRNTVAASTTVSNQAEVEHPALGAPLFTDDPDGDPLVPEEPTVFTVVASVDLTGSQKRVSDVNGGLSVPGDTLRFTIDVRQDGDVPATVVLSDDLPANVSGCTIVSLPPGAFGGCQPGGANGTGLVQVTVPVIAGGQASVVFETAIDAAAPDRASIVNTALLTPLQDASAAVTVQSPPVEVFARALFSTSTKSVSVTEARPTETVSYTIVVENTGPVDASNVVVTDPFPSALSFTSASAGGTFDGSDVTWTIPSIAAGASVTLTAEGVVPPLTPNGTQLINAASIAADAPSDPFTTPSVQTRVIAEPALVVQKTVEDLDGAPTRPGETVRYTLRLENGGDGVATDVVVRDTLDGSFVGAVGPDGSPATGELVVNELAVPELGSIAPGDVVTFTFDATLAAVLPAGTTVSNQAAVNGDELPAIVLSDDPGDPTSDADPTVFSVTSAPILALTKSAVDPDGAPLLPGDVVEFTLTLENTGDAPATSVAVSDVLDANLSWVEGGTFDGSSVRFDVASLAPGTPASFVFRARVASPLADGTVVPNQASVSSAEGVSATSNLVELTVVSIPLLSRFDKTVALVDPDGEFAPGDRVRYTLVLENTGTEAATNVVITDALPGELTNVTASGAATAVVAGNTVTFGEPALAADSTLTVTIEADIVRPLDDAVVVSNQASASADGIDPLSSDDPLTGAPDDPTLFTVRSRPLLTFTKAVLDENGGVVEPGDRLVYTLRLANSGGRAATSVEVTDPVPAELANPELGPGAVLNGSTITFAGAVVGLDVIEVDEEVVLTFAATVRSPLPNQTQIANQALATLTSEPALPPVSSSWLQDGGAVVPGPTLSEVVSGPRFDLVTLAALDDTGAPLTEVSPGPGPRTGPGWPAAGRRGRWRWAW